MTDLMTEHEPGNTSCKRCNRVWGTGWPAKHQCGGLVHILETDEVGEDRELLFLVQCDTCGASGGLVHVSDAESLGA